mgnify:CR=1 FL=1
MHHPQDLARFEARPDLQEAWAKEQSLRAFDESAHHQAAWAAEFGGAAQLAGQSSAMPIQSAPMGMQAQPRPSYMPSMNMYSSSMTMYGMGMQQQFSAFNPALQATDNGKGKGREADFEAAFAQIDASISKAKVEDEVEKLGESIQNTTLDAKEPDFKEYARLSTCIKGRYTYSHGRLWDDMQKSEVPPKEEDYAKWEAEFSQLMSAEREGLEYGEDMQKAWESGLGNYNGESSFDKPIQFDAEGVPQLGDYIFGALVFDIVQRTDTQKRSREE